MPKLSFDLPHEIFASVHKSPEEFAREMRLAAALRWYARGEMSQERAAALAGMNLPEFVRALARERINVFAAANDDSMHEIDCG